MDANPVLVEGRLHDLGDGFTVRRLLPVLQACHVGPMVFFDHMGPAVFGAGQGMDVRPHTYIRLSTVTRLSPQRYLSWQLLQLSPTGLTTAASAAQVVGAACTACCR